MTENRKIRVALTHGDTNGIGYELIFKAFEDPMMFDLCTPIIYGSPKVAAYHCKALELDANFTIISKAEEAQEGKLNLLTAMEEEMKVDLGQVSKEAGQAAAKALEQAMVDYHAGLYDVLVTLPANISTMKGEHFNYASQTDFISFAVNQKGKAMKILVYNGLRIALATDDMPLADVPSHITKEVIVERATTLFQTLKRDFFVSNPRIAVLALNPDDGQGGFQGREEKEIIVPAIAELSEKHINTFGPYAADDFFGNHVYNAFDGILAMYDEQANVPFKLLSDEQGLEVTAGLPIVRTALHINAPHDKAGKNVSDENLLRKAIYIAIDNFRHRIQYDEPMANPLKKLYHERRDDSEKARFNVPKKQENKD